MLDIKKLKKGDILVCPSLNGRLGTIFILKEAANEYGLDVFYWHCCYRIEERKFQVNKKEYTHFCGDDIRLADEIEKCLLWDVMGEYGYFWDDDTNELVKEDDREIGNPEFIDNDTHNGILTITHLNGTQIYVLEQLIKSWQKDESKSN